MKNILLTFAILLGLASGARAQDYSKVYPDQIVAMSSMTIGSIVVGQSFVAVASAPITNSFFIEVQNLSTEQVCCAFDSAAVTTQHSGKACVRIDTASTAARPTANDWKRWSRFAQNLVLYCRSMKSSGTAEIIVTQGK